MITAEYCRASSTGYGGSCCAASAKKPKISGLAFPAARFDWKTLFKQHSVLLSKVWSIFSSEPQYAAMNKRALRS
ncbi:MAG: hypothetical protein ACREDM_10660 [Methylocella sp.]